MTGSVLWLFLTVPRVGLQCVIVVLPDHTHLLFEICGFLDTVEFVITPVHEISNNVACATSKASDQPAHMRSLIRAFASRLSIL